VFRQPGPERQDGLSSVHRLDLRFLTKDDCVLRRVQVLTHDVPHLPHVPDPLARIPRCEVRLAIARVKQAAPKVDRMVFRAQPKISRAGGQEV